MANTKKATGPKPEVTPQGSAALTLLLSTATTIAAGQGTSPDLSIDRAKALIFACMEAAPQFEQQLREWLK